LIQNAIWWIESCDLDGFRVDTYNYSDPKELQLGPNLSPMNTNFNIVEIWMQSQAQMAY
jgi:glycosidase